MQRKGQQVELRAHASQVQIPTSNDAKCIECYVLYTAVEWDLNVYIYKVGWVFLKILPAPQQQVQENDFLIFVEQ